MVKTFNKIEGSCFEKAHAMESNFYCMIEGRMPEHEVLEFAKELLSIPKHYTDKNLLLWALDDPYGMPGDATYDFVYYSSFMALASLAYAGMLFPSVQKLPNYREILQQGLTDCIGTEGDNAGNTFFGHGYEAIDSFLDCMEMFADGCMPLFLEINSDISPVFVKGFSNAIRFIENNLCTGKERSAWGNVPYTERACAVLNKLNSRAIFVYGTLMSGQSAGSSLSGCESKGKHLLRNYGMYQITPHYPGIVPYSGASVVGELFLVPDSLIPDLDMYEGEGSLYYRKLVTVERAGAHTLAQAYIYAHTDEVSGTPMKEPWDSQESDRVWYAAYGSNLSAKRFRCYIQGGICRENHKSYDGCTDKTLWTNTCLMQIPGGMYFARESKSWSSKGVSFYDPSLPGITHMRLYNISRAQMHEVQVQEGSSPNWYGNLLTLGIHEDGCPIYTFTSEAAHKRNPPSDAYLGLIRKALIEECGLDPETANAYLTGCLNA